MKLQTNVFFKILVIIMLSNSAVGAIIQPDPTETHHVQNGQACTNCHVFDEGNKNSIPVVLPATSKPDNSNLKISGNALIQSNSSIQGGGPDCVLCHDINGNGTPPDQRINASAIKQGVHRNLNNGAINTTNLSDSIDKACWACHGNGTEPNQHPDNYKTPYACPDCHNATFGLNLTDPSVISNLTTKTVYEHIPPPYYQEINSILNNSNATCTGCHNMSMINYTDSGFSIASNVSHYASRINLVSPTINCSLCHKNPTNASAYWANLTRHPAKSSSDSFCANCHNTTRAVDLHSQPLVKAKSIHFGFDWNNNDYLNGPNPSEACIACHSSTTTEFRKCEDCHLENGIGPVNTGQIRSDINNTIPRVYAHTNFSNTINVPDQSGVYPGLSIRPSSCFSANASGSTCHGNPYGSIGQNGGFYAYNTISYSIGDPYHSTATIDRLPNTTNCLFCHKQKDITIRNAWGNATQITGGTHDWYMGDDNSMCWECHVSTGVAPKDFHSDTMQLPKTTGGCIACHSNNASRYYVNISLFGLHANVNTSDGLGNVTDDDCKTCHFGAANGTMSMVLGAANQSNTHFCQDCHTTAGTGPIKPTDPNLIKNGLSHGSTDCKWCHIAGNSQPRPLPLELRYHPNGPKGTAAGKNCLSCHYYANLPDGPFHAPGEVHYNNIAFCNYCHSNSNNHAVSPLNSGILPSIRALSVTTPVTSGNPAQIQFTVYSDGMTQIAAAQYQVTNTSGIVVDWTNMTGTFNSSAVTVNASINTFNLKDNYTVNVKGMASAPKTDPSKPYYPLNGLWSSIISTQLTVIQSTGYANGTVSGSLGNIVGATVMTNTSAYTTTDQNGKYSLNLQNGMYILTASKEPEYYSNSSVIVTVTAYTTVTNDIILATKPTGNITGNVRNK
jgi:hypothetical protein